MSRFKGLAEQYDGGREVRVQQEGALVLLAVEATSGSNEGVALITPAQARSLAADLSTAASEADLVAVGDE